MGDSGLGKAGSWPVSSLCIEFISDAYRSDQCPVMPELIEIAKGRKPARTPWYGESAAAGSETFGILFVSQRSDYAVGCEAGV